MSRIGDTRKTRPIIFHREAIASIRVLSKPVRRGLGEALLKLQSGMTLGLPLSKPMSVVMPGVSELRIRDDAGVVRIFYYLKSRQGILVFHAFMKKSQKTPEHEIELGRKRLKELLADE